MLMSGAAPPDESNGAVAVTAETPDTIAESCEKLTASFGFTPSATFTILTLLASISRPLRLMTPRVPVPDGAPVVRVIEPLLPLTDVPVRMSTLPLMPVPVAFAVRKSSTPPLTFDAMPYWSGCKKTARPAESGVADVPAEPM